MASGDLAGAAVYADNESLIITYYGFGNLPLATDKLLFFNWKNGGMLLTANRTA
jgi:hypothetical protein